ncbi:hypothetical protein MMC19_000969 [Ptychographa xylographoides]|nr:hypothetical protein [Ptychographa xylographoides]
MDLLQDYLPTLFNLYATYYAPYEPYIRPFWRYFYIAQAYSYKYLFPTIWPIYRLVTILLSRALSDPPDLITLAVLAVILFASLKVIGILQRQIMYWISIGVKLLMYMSVALLGIYVYQRGFDQALEDFGWLAGLWVGLEEQGGNLGKGRSRTKMAEARRAERGTARGRTRGGGW